MATLNPSYFPPAARADLPRGPAVVPTVMDNEATADAVAVFRLTIAALGLVVIAAVLFG